MNTRITFAAVQRHTLFSPNHVDNDAAILHAVADRILHAGHSVNFYTEQEFTAHELTERYIFSMIRTREAMKRLQQYEDSGCVGVNSGYGIENCIRERMTRLLLDAGVSHPRSFFLRTFDSIPAGISEPCWVKRADSHAVQKEDVTYVPHPEELKEVMDRYAGRGIDRVVVNEHIEGDLIKFYGVNGTDFFYWFYPFDAKHSKFGLEEINGAPAGFAFEADGLQRLCNQAASVLRVDVYGGDAIVAKDGTIRIIDFNDWPSFAPCREEAADAICRILLDKVK